MFAINENILISIQKCKIKFGFEKFKWMEKIEQKN